MLIVTLPPKAAAQATAYSERALRAGATLLEVRGDLTPGLRPFACALPLLLAPRGGDLQALAAQGAAWIDQEEHEPVLEVPGAARILSFHDYNGPVRAATLLARGQRLRACGADLVKLAVHARDASDLLALAQVRVELAAEGPTTVLAMGPWAELDRARSPWTNASTYAALDPDWCAAPGQWTLARHAELAGSSPPPIYGLLGGPEFCARSASPQLFRLLFARHGLRAAYLRFPSMDAAQDLGALAALGVLGLSVTAPHKRSACELLREQGARLSLDAERAGALNTVLLDPLLQRPVAGEQFDSLGLCRAYPELADLGPVAVVGSGGVVPAVLLAAERLHWRPLTVFARNAGRRAELEQRFGVATAPLESLEHARPKLLVWTLPCEVPQLALPAAGTDAFALDLRYGAPTAFQARARELGYSVRDGAAMLVHQALAQFTAFCAQPTSAEDARCLGEQLALRGI